MPYFEAYHNEYPSLQIILRNPLSFVQLRQDERT